MNAKRKPTKPEVSRVYRGKPVKAWAYVNKSDPTAIVVQSVRTSRTDLRNWSRLPGAWEGWRIARVEIREVGR